MKSKILAGIALMVFFVFTTALLTAGLISYGRQKDKGLGSGGDSITKEASASDSGEGGVALTLEEVAKHSNASDCWLVVDGNVYNVSDFVNKHPGGSLLVTKYCGKDATGAFNTRDRNPPESHSSFARNLLRSYYLGPLGKVPDNIAFPDAGNPGGSSVLPPNIPTLVPGSGKTSVVIDTAEVARHNTLQNCWMIIGGKVYDLTSFISQHPGGATAITDFCGKDGTNAFRSKGGRGTDHSSYAYSLLNNFLIASLGSSVAVPTSSPVVNLPPNPTNPPVVNNPPPGSNLNLTMSEVATHNTLQNCWIVISGKVYNVTSYISQHPGGVSAIVSNCGTDATTAFQTKGGRGSNHSGTAYNLLNNFLIGSLGSSVPVNPTQPPGGGGGGGGSTPTPVSGGNCPSNIPQSICSKYSGSTVTYQSGKYEDNGSWEGQVNVNGSCRHIKTNSSGAVSSDENC